jgi:hypothetical protein
MLKKHKDLRKRIHDSRTEVKRTSNQVNIHIGSISLFPSSSDISVTFCAIGGVDGAE